jgi:hypothetical protein
MDLANNEGVLFLPWAFKTASKSFKQRVFLSVLIDKERLKE